MIYKNSNWLKKGDIYYRKGMFYEAINCYDQGLRQDPYNTLLRVKKGNALCRLACVSKAIDCYYNATTQAGAFEMLAVYVRDNYKNLGRNLKKLQQTLKSKYNLPFYQKQLKIFLVSIKNQMRDIIEQQEFEEFEKKMPFKRFVLLADYIETFIKHYGKDYKNHIPRFHQYLLYKHYNITRSELEGRIRKQKKIMERPRWRQKNSIDLMTGKEFEEFLANLFHQKGYKTTVTQPSYDKGCDILLELYGKKKVVQAKRKKQNIGNTAIFAAFAAKKLYHASEALVITTSYFTRPAREQGKKLGVELWNRERLLQELKTLNYII